MVLRHGYVLGTHDYQINISATAHTLFRHSTDSVHSFQIAEKKIFEFSLCYELVFARCTHSRTPTSGTTLDSEHIHIRHCPRQVYVFNEMISIGTEKNNVCALTNSVGGGIVSSTIGIRTPESV